jgi:uncharacterized protein (TIGR00288 family)
MSQPRETNLALFLDFDNLAIGARDARQRLEIRLLIQRILEKGKIIVKRAYADWHHHKEHMSALHEAAIDLIEVPAPRISGKNSADIRMVVDAMDLCYSKEHIDTFVICSGDSDFSPLVSKLRENNKRVIGVGMKNSSSNLLIGNCDEFIFYDDIYRQNLAPPPVTGVNVPLGKREMFEFLVQTVQSLLQESRDVLYSSLIKDTMTRKMPHFSERALGYATFGDVLEEARGLGLLKVERDARSGGTWVVHGLGAGSTAEAVAAGALPEAAAAAPGTNGNGAAAGRSSRRRRRSGRGGSGARSGNTGGPAVEPGGTSATPAAATPAPAAAATGRPRCAGCGRDAGQGALAPSACLEGHREAGAEGRRQGEREGSTEGGCARGCQDAPADPGARRRARRRSRGEEDAPPEGNPGQEGSAGHRRAGNAEEVAQHRPETAVSHRDPAWLTRDPYFLLNSAACAPIRHRYRP